MFYNGKNDGFNLFQFTKGLNLFRQDNHKPWAMFIMVYGL